MITYIIRTNTQDSRTYLLKRGEEKKKIATIFTDFVPRLGKKMYFKEDIVDSQNKTIATLHLPLKNNLIELRKGKQPLSEFNLEDTLFIDEELFPHHLLDKAKTMRRVDKVRAKEQGLTHSYAFPDNSPLHSIQCYEKNGNFASVILPKKEDDQLALKLLPLVLSETIKKQEYILEFLK